MGWHSILLGERERNGEERKKKSQGKYQTLLLAKCGGEGLTLRSTGEWEGDRGWWEGGEG